MPSLLERPKMTRAMYEALKRHIMREREKKKQVEQEQDAMMERLRKERELKKKKEEEDNLTLEQTNDQIISLEKKLEELKQQKKDIYSQLKKASHQEDETLKRAQQKEQSELTMSQTSYPHPALTAAPQQMLIHGRPALYKPTVPPPMLTGMKRQRTPTPPPSSAPSSAYSNYGHSEPKYLHTSESKYVPHARGGAGGAPEMGKYPTHAEAAAKFSGHPDTKYMSSPYQAGGKVGATSSGGHLYAAQHPPQPGDFSKLQCPICLRQRKSSICSINHMTDTAFRLSTAAISKCVLLHESLSLVV
ncbi:G protein pathway suppressor 2 [Elysia marginata]|uniref:G protein pathway suppressor 2 n=1 Tax=Elysia marginata TaxID=1093978 RepID=A0AAV4GAX6_9GAST|nr:G protein pathway suppressor 2 [Elysia marginata]